MTVVAFDLETHPFGPRQQAPKPVCMSIMKQGDSEPQLYLANDIPRILGPHLASGATITAHNAAFDFCVLLEHFPQLRPAIWDAYEADRVSCTRMRERLIDIEDGMLGFANIKGVLRNKPYTLGNLAHMHLGHSLDKGEDSWRTRYAQLEDVPLDRWPRRALDYALEDAEYCLSLYLHQGARLKKLEYEAPTQFNDTRADLALKLVSAWGIMTDTDRALVLETETEESMGHLRRKLVKLGIMRPRRVMDRKALEALPPRAAIPAHIECSKNTKVIQQLVKDNWPAHLGEPALTKGTKDKPETRKIQTSKDVLEQLDHPMVEPLLAFNALQKAQSTYVHKLVNAGEHPLHSRFDSLGAATGRTSSSNLNLQNQPRLPGVRECFIPRDGHKFIATDYNTQEMRTLAQASLDIIGKSVLAEKYQANPLFDPHQDFANFSGLKRQECKACNFGYPGGLGAKTFIKYARGYGLKIDLKRSEEMKEHWFQQWPEMKIYFQVISSLPGVGEGLAKVLVKQTGFVRGGCGYTDSANSFFQHLGSACSKRSLWDLVRRCYDERMQSWLLGSRIVNFVHDENIAEVADTRVHEVAMEMEKVMVASMEHYTPGVPAAAEATVQDYWSKNAERVFNGRRLTSWRAAAA